MTPTPSDLRKLVADRAVAAEKISRSPINLDDVQAYTDADVAARTAALLALPTLLDRIDALEAANATLRANWQRSQTVIGNSQEYDLAVRLDRAEAERDRLREALASIKRWDALSGDGPDEHANHYPAHDGRWVEYTDVQDALDRALTEGTV